MLNKLHDRTVKSVYVQSGFAGRVHRDATDLSNLCKGQDVSDGVPIEPHLSEVWKIADHGRVLIAPVREGTQHATAVSDVSEHSCIPEHRHGGLGVEKYPIGVDYVFALRWWWRRLGQHERILGQCGPRCCFAGWAVSSVVSMLLTRPTLNVLVRQTVRSGDSNAASAALSECHCTGFGGNRLLYSSRVRVPVRRRGIDGGLVCHEQALCGYDVGGVLISS